MLHPDSPEPDSPRPESTGSESAGSERPEPSPPGPSLSPFDAQQLALEAVSELVGANQRGRAISDYLDTLALHATWRILRDRCDGLPSACFDTELRSVAAEIGIATRSSDRTVQRRISEAVALHERFTATSAAFATGAITRQHVTAIIDEGGMLGHDAELIAEYEQHLLEHAASTTPARLRAMARKTAAQLAPATFDERHAAANAERSVTVRDLDDGMSLLTAYLPSTVAHAIHDRLTELARTNAAPHDAFGRDRPGTHLGPEPDAPATPWCRCTGEPGCSCPADDPSCGCEAPDMATSTGMRPARVPQDGPEPLTADSAAPHDQRWFDEVRADVLADLLLAGRLDPDSPHAAINDLRGRVAITVPALTLLGVDDEPAMLDGVGPIPIETARMLCAGASVWLRMCTDPVSGEPIAADTYRPSAELRRFIDARDQHCRAPGCRRKAAGCDFDHTIPWAAGGATSSRNGAALCRSHHTMKHRGWSLHQGDRGELTWISPNGRRHTDRPNRPARPWTSERLAARGIPAPQEAATPTALAG